MGKLIDLTDKKFGRLTVLKMASERINGEIAWDCRCDCGKELTIKGVYLRSGDTKSCGCLRKDTTKKTMTDRAKKLAANFIGQTFGELTVIEDSGQRASDGSILWRCKCSCGNDNYLIPSSELKREGDRAKKHCGNSIHQIKNLAGQTFGFLEVIFIDESTLGSRKIKWFCKCHNCNRPDLVSIRGGDLTANRSQTCGCGCAFSKGAKKIKEILDQLNITYIAEYKEDTLVNPQTNTKLRFDFYLPNDNIYIEYDGEQHFKASSGWNTEEKVKHTQYLDTLKNKWCLNNHKQLYRIPYFDIDNINTYEDIVQEKYLVTQEIHEYLI